MTQREIYRGYVVGGPVVSPGDGKDLVRRILKDKPQLSQAGCAVLGSASRRSHARRGVELSEEWWLFWLDKTTAPELYIVHTPNLGMGARQLKPLLHTYDDLKVFASLYWPGDTRRIREYAQRTTPTCVREKFYD